MARTDPQLNFRCPDDLKEELESSASANARSLTGEIVHRLRESLDGKAFVLPDGFRERLVERAKTHGWPLESEVLHTLADALDPAAYVLEGDDDSKLTRELLRIVGYALLHVTSKPLPDKNRADEMLVALRRVAMTLHNGDLQRAAVEASEMAFGGQEAHPAIPVSIRGEPFKLVWDESEGYVAIPARDAGDGFEIPAFLRKPRAKAAPKKHAKKR